MDLNSNSDGRVRVRISYITICIAGKSTLFVNRPYAWWVKKPGPFTHECNGGGNRSHRQNAFAIPPPSAGVTGLRFPICTDRRSPLTTASSRGGEIRPSNATAAGDESSASVSALWLSTPRYPGQNGTEP